jgi:hypothetical protein
MKRYSLGGLRVLFILRPVAFFLFLVLATNSIFAQSFQNECEVESFIAIGGFKTFQRV